MTNGPPRRAYSIAEAAYLLNVAPKSLSRWLNAGTVALPSIRAGRRRLIPADALDAFLAGRQPQHGDAP